MNVIKDAMYTYEKELRKILDKPEQTKVDLDAVTSISKILKNLETVCAMRDGNDEKDEWSGRMYRNGRYSGRSMDNGYSMNYSGHGTNRMLDNLYSAMSEAETEDQRMAIKSLMDKYAH